MWFRGDDNYVFTCSRWVFQALSREYISLAPLEANIFISFELKITISLRSSALQHRNWHGDKYVFAGVLLKFVAWHNVI